MAPCIYLYRYTFVTLHPEAFLKTRNEATTLEECRLFYYKADIGAIKRSTSSSRLLYVAPPFYIRRKTILKLNSGAAAQLRYSTETSRSTFTNEPEFGFNFDIIPCRGTKSRKDLSSTPDSRSSSGFASYYTTINIAKRSLN